MKRIVTLFLVLCMLFALCACGAEEKTETAAEVSVTEGGEEKTESSSEEKVEPRKLTVVNGYGLTDVGSLTLAAFCDYVEENTNGEITFDRYFGGTMCALPEEFALVSSGAADVCVLLQDFVIADMPLCNIPGSTIDDQMGGINYWRYIMFENEETAALIEAEATEHNVKFVDVQSGGIGSYVCTQEFHSWADLSNLKFGAVRNANIYEGLGLNVVTAETTDAYDCLSRGVYDANGMGLGSIVASKWYEVAPYCMSCAGYSACNYLTVNLDVWNSLTAEQQQVFKDAAALAAEMSVELNDEVVETAAEYFDEFGWFSEEDSLAYNRLQFESIAATDREFAAAKGIEDQFDIIYDACMEYLGY